MTAITDDTLDFDPVDLALLAAGYERNGTISLTIDRAEFLLDCARMLHRLWLELESMEENEWNGVWAYDVAEPLGRALCADGIDSTEQAEHFARRCITVAMA